MSIGCKGTVRLYLVRHGETGDNVQMRYLGIRDEPLTPNGLRQALLVAAALAPIRVGGIFSSPLVRAADTALRIKDACAVELRLDSRLVEGSFGEWEGLTRDEVLKRSARDAETLARWELDSSIAPPGGESIEHVQMRVISLANELAESFSNQSVVLVSHVGPIKALLAAVLDIPLAASRRLFLDPATITVVEWGERPLVRLLNSHAHLGWSSARWM